MKKVGVLMLSFVFLFCLWALPVMAADKEIEQLKGEVQKLLNKIQELEKKQQESEKKFESVEKAATKLEQEEAKLKEEKKTRAISYWRDGWNIETPDKKFRLNMAGVLHFDTRVYESGRSATSLDIRRARYDMRGSLYTGDIEHVFRLQIEMADTPYLRNAYWMFKFRPELNVQIGQMKIPSGGADFLTEEAHVNFVEYATDTPISPHFDRGIFIKSFFLDGKVQTCLGVFNGTGIDADTPTSGDWDSNKNWVARLLLVPFKDSENMYIKGLHLAGSYEDGIQSSKTVRGEASNRTENYESNWYRWVASTVNLDERRRYGGELHWIIGSFAASYEFNRVEWENLRVRNSSGKLLSHLKDSYHSDVNQVWVSYFLTGEQKTFEDVFFAWRQPKPKKNFSIKDGTWGAWEVMARYALHDTSKELFEGTNPVLDGVNKGYSVTGGLRWIWNPKTRIMVDLNYLKTDEGTGISVSRNEHGLTGRDYKDSETALLMRLILTP